jgi:hypothetical protein
MPTSKSISSRSTALPKAQSAAARNSLAPTRAKAEREKAILRKGRARLESEARVDETDIRSSLI